jgi:hypothetical protein
VRGGAAGVVLGVSAVGRAAARDAAADARPHGHATPEHDPPFGFEHRGRLEVEARELDAPAELVALEDRGEQGEVARRI